MDTFSAPIEKASTSTLTKVFGWMCGGLLVSALTAYWVAGTPRVMDAIIGNQAVFLGLIILELILVVSLSWLIRRISAGAATALFVAYAIVNGLTLSIIVLAYTDASLSFTFFTTAGMFGAMALYGYLTKRDLSGFGAFFTMAIFGIIIASLVNIFIANSALNLVISIVGVLLFTGLTAYDVQKIKNMELVATDDASRSKLAIFGALMLYLDFINIFLSLLRLTGRKRN